MAERRDYYEVLCVARDASGEEVSASYRRLAIQYHPDKNPGDDEAIARFKEAAEAFEVLGDDEKRSLYDRYGHAGIERAGGGRHFSDLDDIFSAFGDIFGDIMGGGRRRRGPRRGADVRAKVTLDLEEAARGVTKEIRFKRHEACADCDGSGATPGTEKKRCDYCGGHGRVVQAHGIFRMQTACPSCEGAGVVIEDPCTICRGSGKMLKQVTADVQIPPGVDNGMQVRIPEQGEKGHGGGPRGDCYCEIHVREHALFERDGQSLICRMPITFAQAALGTTVEVPTLDGARDLRIPSGTQTGHVFRLRGLGLPDPRRRGVGDLLVQANIEVPKKLGAREKELLRELAELEQSSVAPQRKTFIESLKDYFTAGSDTAPTED